MSMASDKQLNFPLDRLLLTNLEEMLVFQRNVALLGSSKLLEPNCCVWF